VEALLGAYWTGLLRPSELIDAVSGYFDTYPSARITRSLSDFIRNITKAWCLGPMTEEA
jgi:hypothetical protein